MTQEQKKEFRAKVLDFLSKREEQTRKIKECNEALKSAELELVYMDEKIDKVFKTMGDIENSTMYANMYNTKKVEEISGIVLNGVFHERVETPKENIFLECQLCSLYPVCEDGRFCDAFNSEEAGHHFQKRGICKIEGSDV